MLGHSQGKGSASGHQLDPVLKALVFQLLVCTSLSIHHFQAIGFQVCNLHLPTRGEPAMPHVEVDRELERLILKTRSKDKKEVMLGLANGGRGGGGASSIPA